ncbi:MAG: Appr-1-p processing protein [Candidatus Abyssobacteria bacterium SURF_17]|uniref:Appr-1-p processing protein n=1 Tax=Candidatus Abyssobacteria bacterium SURF_17 TaxID=2093361 RepID=A0A419F144_9BACT|nr:MAG: Appr-1-p processing protein [Candidatus Abyssubacteria bacterium SURF_17]
MPLNIILCDINKKITAAWQQHFEGVENVEVHHGNIFEVEADALVSPANSFGFMDGGLDYAISEFFDWKIQPRVQAVLQKKHHGELPVGQAEVVETGEKRFPYLICAPTMRTPADVSQTLNAYLAMRAILIAIRRFNKAHPNAIKSVVIPGLGTAVGKMPADRCARQMRAAYDNIVGGHIYHFNSLREARREERKLLE